MGHDGVKCPGFRMRDGVSGIGDSSHFGRRAPADTMIVSSNDNELNGKGMAMSLGFIESKTYDEISVGDTAGTEHVLTTEDAMAFASISGFHSMLNADELKERAGGIPPTGPNMWCASLISGLFSMNIPGPGCTLTDVSLSFKNRIHVGDRILVKVTVTAKDDATKKVTFDCEAKNGAGTADFFRNCATDSSAEKVTVFDTAGARADCEQSLPSLPGDDCTRELEACSEDGDCVAVR